ncbi:Primosomal protein N' [Corynebacterium heidelbergense]|uniref:primosomal protein N' n=1 Tax=Corynebacterium heidelbergense TaxID=2055947 RepID=UPI00235A14BA|nr:primosomal protein N' [Corynebacterium heidelbergense]WCZ36594.1 Primosomal protein N' [Corynebacterium heidelbergense]
MNEPVARVLPLLSVPHLDRLFDYRVSHELYDTAQPGVRVRVRFSGRLVDAILIERRRSTDYAGQLKPIERVVSPIPVVPEYLWRMVGHLAERSAGTRSDIIRSVIPPRHARAEADGLFGGGKPWADLVGSLVPVEECQRSSMADATAAWSAFRFGPELVRAAVEGRHPRASVLIPPGLDPAELVAALAAATAWGEGGVLVLAPTNRAVHAVVAALRRWLSAAQITQMTAAESPATRYRRYLAIVKGQARVVVGTRSAMLLPVAKLRLVVVLGEGDDNLVDPRAPYLHAREVAMHRAEAQEAGLVFTGVHRSAELQQWVEQGRLHTVRPAVEELRRRMPLIRAVGDSEVAQAAEATTAGSGRIPHVAFTAIRSALQAGSPALIQVPRRGYAPALACSACRAPARCRACNGPLELRGQEDSPVVPTCRWCGRPDPAFRCGDCGHRGVRMTVLGHDRTAEELGRAFPGIPVVRSSSDRIVDSVRRRPEIVVATPGAEPRVAEGLYGAAVLLDPWLPLGRQDLRAGESALRQWMEAAALVSPRADGGCVVLAGEPHHAAVQQLIRWDPLGAARRELVNRREAQFPPAVTVAAVDGTAQSVQELLQCWEAPPESQVLGPVPLPAGVRLPAGLTPTHADQARRAIIRVPHAHAHALGTSLRTAQNVRQIQHAAAPLRVVMDPVRIG